MSSGHEITDQERTRIVSDFVLHSPPGEFNEVFNDCRLLLNNDSLLRERCGWAFAQYNSDQFLPVKIEGAQQLTLITQHNDLGNSRFYDPRSQKSFLFDHLRKEASDVQPQEPDAKSEPFRAALQNAADKYIENHYDHYESSGIVAVFGKTEGGKPRLTLCIESHKFQPKNYSNGRWRSEWSVHLTGKEAELKGIIKVQVHYYEDGNVQLVSSKEITKKITVDSEAKVAKDIIQIIEDEESAYQMAVFGNYQTMSDTTFKALRRQLPITRTKIDWSRLQSYRVGAELKMS